MNDSARQVFFSYAWGGESERIANELDADLQARGLAVVRDKRDLGYKGKIGEFMREIGRGHAVVVVISDKYLKSPNCMYELVEIARNPDVHDRIFPVVLQDADIYNPVNRIRYIKHWEDKLKELDEAMRSVSAANLQGVRDEIDSYDAIRDSISGLTSLLKDMNTLTPDMHENSNFASLIDALQKRLEAGASAAAGRGAVTPAQTLSTPATPAPTVPALPAADTSAYLADIGERLAKAGYLPLKGERFGPLRFKLAFDRHVKSFIGAEHFRVLVLEEPALGAQRYAALHEQLWAYAKEQNDKHFETMIFTGLVLTPGVADDVKDAIYNTPHPKLPWAPTFLATLAVYGVAENDIFFPTELAEQIDANFEENIKKYLVP